MLKTTKSVCFSLAASTAVVVAITGAPRPAKAGAEPFIGELMLVPYSFCPRNFTEAAGQILPISQNQALFSLLGTTYGGDGRTTFRLPDLRGRVPVGSGQGAGLSNVRLGQNGGAESVSLSVDQMPPHTHAATTAVTIAATLKASATTATGGAPSGNVLADTKRRKTYHAGPADADMDASAIAATGTGTTTIASAGGGQSFSIRPPYLGLRWCIALQGIFPSRN